MFRYIALAFSTEDPAGCSSASQFAKKLQLSTEWRCVMSRPGLSVFATGIKPGINGVYRLVPDQGVVLGRLFRRSELADPLRPDVFLTASDVAKILKSQGRALVDDYWGRYVAVMYDAGSGGSRILRDPTGALPCYLIEQSGVCIVFSWLEDVLKFAQPTRSLAAHWDYLAVSIPAGPSQSRETATVDVTQVLAGEAITIAAHSRASTLYWNATDFALRVRAHEEPVAAAAALRSTVRACVQAWAGAYGKLLLRLSGGVDSSIVASCLAEGHTPARVACVNYYSPGSNSDERSYARLAAARVGRQLIERQRDPAFRLERVLDVARTPNPVEYVGRMDATRMDADLAAAHDVSALFTGGGGDQLFIQYATHWSAADYLRVRGFDAGFVAAGMDAARLGSVSIWKVLHSTALDRLRRNPIDLRADAGKYMALINPEVVQAARLDHRFMHPGLISAIDVPPAKMTQIAQLLDPIEYYDPYEREAAPEYVDPLLSQPVIELCLHLPIYILTNGGRGRALARQAFAADLPVEIARRRSKGGMEEHIKEVLRRNLEFVRGVLLDGALARGGILDRAKVEEVLSGRPTTLESHAAEVYTYLGIEAWLSRCSATANRAVA